MLTNNQQKICKILFWFRGMPAALMAKYFYNSMCPTYSNEKYIYSVLNRLIKVGYVAHSPIKYKDRNVSFYYLTPKGLEQIKVELGVTYNGNGNGKLPASSETTYWDIPYEYYKPPLKQTDHHMQLLELLHTFYVFNFNYAYFYTSHYSNLCYGDEYIKLKIRPDAMIEVKEDKYAVEIDTSSEWHKQLSDKFMKYKNYINHCEKNGTSSEIKGIFFVMPSDLPMVAYKRRWETVSKSFVEVFGLETFKLNLFLVTRDTLYELLNYLNEKEAYEDQLWKEMLRYYSFQSTNLYTYDSHLFVKYEDDSYALVLKQFNYSYEIKFLYDLFINYENFMLLADKEISYKGVKCKQREINLVQGVLKGKMIQNYKSLNTWNIPIEKLELYARYKSKPVKIIEI